MVFRWAELLRIWAFLGRTGGVEVKDQLDWILVYHWGSPLLENHVPVRRWEHIRVLAIVSSFKNTGFPLTLLSVHAYWANVLLGALIGVWQAASLLNKLHPLWPSASPPRSRFRTLPSRACRRETFPECFKACLLHSQSDLFTLILMLVVRTAAAPHPPGPLQSTISRH